MGQAWAHSLFNPAKAQNTNADKHTNSGSLSSQSC